MTMYDGKTRKAELQETLERGLLQGLSLEWEHALWVLDETQRHGFKKPLFSLRDMGRQLGSWSRLKNEISLSRRHVLNCPWDDTREILLHEMAHQYADQVLGAHEESPHGPLFKKACHLLRANPAASGTCRPLHARLHEHPRNPHDRHVIRIRKLMSLAESKNIHEAEAAMAKAHELMEKYNIECLQQGKSRNFMSVFVGDPALRHFREAYYLANLLQDYYFVQGLWVSAYVLDKGRMGRVLEISGTAQNIKIASYVHVFVNRYIETRWREYNQGKKLGRYRKSDFAVGLIEGFTNKLSGGRQFYRESRAADTRALVTHDDLLLKGYMAHRYPHTRSFSRSSLNHDAGIVEDGFEIGKRMIISKGIERRQAPRDPARTKLLAQNNA